MANVEVLAYPTFPVGVLERSCETNVCETAGLSEYVEEASDDIAFCDVPSSATPFCSESLSATGEPLALVCAFELVPYAMALRRSMIEVDVPVLFVPVG